MSQELKLCVFCGKTPVSFFRHIDTSARDVNGVVDGCPCSNALWSRAGWNDLQERITGLLKEGYEAGYRKADSYGAREYMWDHQLMEEDREEFLKERDTRAEGK
jgi:hypothetical protein